MEFMVTPRYLAGTDNYVTQTISAILLTRGWQSESDGKVRIFRTGDGACEARHAECDRALHKPGHPAMSWEFTGQPANGQPWRACFTRATPPEIVADFVRALPAAWDLPRQRDRRAAALTAPAPGEVTRPLMIAGWHRNHEPDHVAWQSPDHQCVVIPGAGSGGWLVSARRLTDLLVMWFAYASSSLPAHLGSALCAAIADPEPVLRSVLPPSEAGALTIPVF